MDVAGHRSVMTTALASAPPFFLAQQPRSRVSQEVVVNAAAKRATGSAPLLQVGVAVLALCVLH